ncbi:MAG: DUF2158 domain-containing protein [Alphaproteobacteria bacterium]|nr:DUF2158 domain-containing protein [Alphaproteobacteria bacterium]
MSGQEVKVESKTGEIIPPDFDEMGCEAGDVVILRSGGPAMTVVRVEDGMADCIWFDTAENMRSAQIPLIALDIIEEDEGASGMEEAIFGELDDDFIASDDGDSKKKKKKKKKDDSAD